MSSGAILLTIALLVRAITKICDKYLISGVDYEPDMYAIFTRIYSVLFVLAVILFARVDMVLSHVAMMAMVAGGLKFLSLVFFFRCLKRSDVAMCVGLKQSLGLILPFLIMSLVDISGIGVLGACLVLFFLAACLWGNGNVLEQYVGVGKRSCLYLLASCCLEFAYIAVLKGFSSHSYLQLFCWSRMGAFMVGGVFLCLERRWKRFLGAVRKGKIGINAIIGCNELLSVGGKLTIVYLVAGNELETLGDISPGTVVTILVILLVSAIGLVDASVYGKITTPGFKKRTYGYVGIAAVLIACVIVFDGK